MIAKDFLFSPSAPSPAEILAFIKKVISDVCNSLSKSKQQPALPVDKVEEYAKERFLSADKKEISADFRSLSDEDLLTHIKEFLYTLLSVGDRYYTEFAGLLQKIQEDENFAHKFFYGNSVKPNESICHIRQSLIAKTRKNYGIYLDDLAVGSIIYAHLWQEGTWRSLKLFHFRSSFFFWLKKVSSNAVNQFLKDNFFIPESTCLTPSNARINWKSKSPEVCQVMLDELFLSSSTYSFMSALMGERLSEQEIKIKLHIADHDFKSDLKKAEKELLLALLNQEHCFKDFLTYKVAPKHFVSSEILAYKPDPDGCSYDSPFSDVFSGIDHAEKIQSLENFVQNSAAKFFRDPLDRKIFTQRFLFDKDPVSLGLELGRKRSNIDCRYSRCKTEIFPAFRSWYDSQVNPLHSA